MNHPRTEARSPYMEWAKLHSSARFNLATSGMAPLPLKELGVQIEQLEINGASAYGYDPILQALAARYRVPKECVVSAIGTSFANHLALAAITDPGDEVLIEQPAYDPLLQAAQYLSLRVTRFQRPPERGFAIDLDSLKRSLNPHTRVIVITNLHNPSGVFCPDSTMREVAELARKNGSFILVDEVYREMLFADTPQTAFHIDPERFVITNSLTKAYGLSGLRCGWVLAPPHAARQMWRIHDLHAASLSHPSELLSAIALEKLAQIEARMKTLLDGNRHLLRQFLDSRGDLDYAWPDYGTIVFPRLRKGDSEAFCNLLRNQFETSVVPGRFFECPDRFRMGVGLPTAEVRSALEQFGKGLDAAFLS